MMAARANATKIDALESQLLARDEDMNIDVFDFGEEVEEVESDSVDPDYSPSTE
jgi:hypothetical protein